jgi:NAD(P)-dependent dehydrogenase (short-subunit alcohol dehydrogenase family)
MGRFDGKVAIVTGAAGGIGEAYARALAAEGAAVVVADVDEQRGAAVAADLETHGAQAAFTAVDVSSPESTHALAGAAVERFGGIDLLVNNAAIYGGMRLDLLLTVDWGYYERFMGVNFNGALLCTRACYPHMVGRGGGAVVNQSSTAAYMYGSFYGLAKAGINALTYQLAHELGGMDIRVNAIAPGPIDTEATRTTTPPGIVDEIVEGLALKRQGTTADLVPLCLFLLSDDASWITGQVFDVDGGQINRT